MPRYDELSDRSGRYRQPSRARPYSRWRTYRDEALGQTPGRYKGREHPELLNRDREETQYDDYVGEYLPMGAVSASQERMGMRDFSEHYGRYSGGSPYSYEYSERTIYHRPRFSGAIGFSRPLSKGTYGQEPRTRFRRREVAEYDLEYGTDYDVEFGSLFEERSLPRRQALSGREQSRSYGRRGPGRGRWSAPRSG
jgi:hypothetical protein